MPFSFVCVLRGRFFDNSSLPNPSLISPQSGVDKIRFYNFPANVISSLRDITSEVWMVDYYKEGKDHPNCHELKLVQKGDDGLESKGSGKPWKEWGTGALLGRILLMKCIKMLIGKQNTEILLRTVLLS